MFAEIQPADVYTRVELMQTQLVAMQKSVDMATNLNVVSAVVVAVLVGVAFALLEKIRATSAQSARLLTLAEAHGSVTDTRKDITAAQIENLRQTAQSTAYIAAALAKQTAASMKEDISAVPERTAERVFEKIASKPNGDSSVEMTAQQS